MHAARHDDFLSQLPPGALCGCFCFLFCFSFPLTMEEEMRNATPLTISETYFILEKARSDCASEVRPVFLFVLGCSTLIGGMGTEETGTTQL